MSRLIVKNLPKNVTDIKLKELFSQKGIVTDVQLKYKEDGKFRRFAFIGYKTEEQAKLAQSYFDQTCIDTCKISVEQCAHLGAKSKEKPIDSAEKNDISKTKDKIDKKKKKKKADKNENVEVKKALEKHKEDPLFMEFLETHTSKDAKVIWKNDIDIPMKEEVTEESDDESEDKEDGESKESTGEVKLSNEKDKPDWLCQSKIKSLTKAVPKHGPLTFYTVKMRGLAYKHMKKHIKQFFRPIKPKSIRVPQKIKGIAYVGFKTEQAMKKALMKNKSFLEGKQIFVSKYEQKEEIEDFNKDSCNKTNIKWKKQEEALKNEESIAESGRIFIRNLTYTVTEDDIKKLFEKYGPLSEVDLPVDRITRKPKGFGTVTFLMPEHAVKAYSELDGSVLDGRMLHILPGKTKASLEDIDTENLTYKQKKELQTKATAGSSHNWNTLFLGQNAVADAIASRYNTTKEKLLEDGSNGMSAAVKLALGETQLAQDAKTFLEENGVCLDAFNGAPKKRSNTIILVKNLPAETKPNELQERFAKHGELARIVMPPAGITALVEFLEPSEARKAFQALAYTKYKHLPLYLEWAPDNSFTTSASKTKATKNKATTKKSTDSEKVKDEKTIEQSKEKEKNTRKKENNESTEPVEPDTTLFVKNINFSTTEEQLKDYFGKCGPLHYVTIATKMNPENPAEKLSMGYGFIRYKRKLDADRALKTLQMSVLDGKSLELKRSERTLMSDVKTARKKSKITEQNGTKILVRNIPFQATIQEVTELFKSYGELKAVRLPKKLIGTEKHRGFAFIEYYTKTDAKKAFEALCQSTHLYGRRLVLEWAQAEEGIEEIRRRTAKHFYQESSTKKFKKSRLDPESVGLELNLTQEP
ncbi:probable RNA-binding protein 19 isoform X1 [Solenopsis invicta]|uniref:probable RNA-binding protein 19 isoform X1 n=1 Tax=Solenopsis invicta TaxID=13686 RepID=UPI000595CCC3|nr:probable RNA-binding protein 19 isoform X1 [Solenopsis invicta]XP_011167405.1 probable RNA-binding protein 19 isoform X1 [Solenopsis invicta]XP_011167406.1 probable RNA-binding protein 19 isoform X1 [Solenopsis invicta]